MFVDLSSLINVIYPVGSIYMSASATNPGTLFGGTWVAWGTGRVPVGVNTSDGNFNTTEKTGGNAINRYTPSGSNAGTAITAAQMPSHNHGVSITSRSTSISHRHTVGAHAHGLNGHTHSIPALSGSTSKNGLHDHRVNITYEKTAASGSNSNRPASGNILSYTSKWAYLDDSGDHRHTISTNASTTGGNTGSTANSSAFDTAAGDSNHTHSVIGDTGSNGSGQAHTHTFTGTAMNVSTLQPYITCYMWKRTK